MKYNLLSNYKLFLASLGLRPNTIKTYYNRMAKLLEGDFLTNDSFKIDISSLIFKLSHIHYKNQFSQSKNALLYFCKCYQISITNKQLKDIERLQKQTRKKYRKSTKAEYPKIKRTIDRLKNKKLKVSYLTMIETGLRVSELSQIKIEDCRICNEEICFSFIGKGGKKAFSTISKKDNTPLYVCLKDTILYYRDKGLDSKKLFYSSQYLQQKAKLYGFSCLDLRRISAKLEYKKSKSKHQVRNKLRHAKIKTTYIYLNSPVKMKDTIRGEFK